MIRLTQGSYFGSHGDVNAFRGLRVTRTNYTPHAIVPPHCHERAYLCLVTAGGFRERSSGGQADFGAGTVVWHAPGSAHQDRFAASGGACTNVELGDEWLARLDDEGLRLRDWTHARGGAIAWFAARIDREVVRGDDLSGLAVESLICALFAELARTSPAPTVSPPWLDRVTARLVAEFRAPPSVTQLARDVGVHRGHLARTFSRHLGCSISDFIRRARIDWACEQIRRRGCPPLSLLALEAGFADQAHFTRAFKRVTGHPPAAYRRSATPS
jgi:AraC family transcriptional regulator